MVAAVSHPIRKMPRQTDDGTSVHPQLSRGDHQYLECYCAYGLVSGSY
jgi:hypothetical protein